MYKYILSIDAGTTGITILLFDHSGTIIHKEYSEFEQIYPQPGWVEHNPTQIWEITKDLLFNILNKYSSKYISSIGITNQRETIVLWNKKTGLPIYNAIVWQCGRTKEYCDNLINKGYSKEITDKTGLVINSYFSASKINWIIKYVPNAKKLIKNKDLLFGTIDTWLIWKLTNGKSYFTDHTNASRTMLYNINKLDWDNDLLSIFDIPKHILPEILNSSDNFGRTSKSSITAEININGVAGDQQSALFGQNGFYKNDIKCTYGTGCFILINTGNKRTDSNSGLLTTIACNENGRPCYALEGSVFMGGAVIQWLRDELKIINDANESESIATSINSSDGLYIVPAFTGLGSPYWDMSARGLITGITRGTSRSHLVRSSLESIAYQVFDLISTINQDLNTKIKLLKVDGGATKNNFLIQFQSDILNMNIERPSNIESTALGAAFLAGLGSYFWTIDDVKNIRNIESKFEPNINNNTRKRLLFGWKQAIARTKGDKV